MLCRSISFRVLTALCVKLQHKAKEITVMPSPHQRQSAWSSSIAILTKFGFVEVLFEIGARLHSERTKLIKKSVQKNVHECVHSQLSLGNFLRPYSPVMRGKQLVVVASVMAIFYHQTAQLSNVVSLHSSHQLRSLPR